MTMLSKKQGRMLKLWHREPKGEVQLLCLELQRKPQGEGLRLMPSGTQGKVENKSEARRQGTHPGAAYKHRNRWTLSPALRFSDDRIFCVFI